jgi:Acyl-CoA hydrolase
MEVRVDVAHTEDGKELAASAYFVFVSRDINDNTKAIPVPELAFEGEEDKEGCLLRYEYGVRNQQERKLLANVFTFIPLTPV